MSDLQRIWSTSVSLSTRPAQTSSPVAESRQSDEHDQLATEHDRDARRRCGPVCRLSTSHTCGLGSVINPSINQSIDFPTLNNSSTKADTRNVLNKTKLLRPYDPDREQTLDRQTEARDHT